MLLQGSCSSRVLLHSTPQRSAFLRRQRPPRTPESDAIAAGWAPYEETGAEAAAAAGLPSRRGGAGGGGCDGGAGGNHPGRWVNRVLVVVGLAVMCIIADIQLDRWKEAGRKRREKEGRTEPLTFDQWVQQRKKEKLEKLQQDRLKEERRARNLQMHAQAQLSQPHPQSPTSLPRADNAGAEEGDDSEGGYNPSDWPRRPLPPPELHAANTERLERLHADARSIFQAALDAADPRRMILSCLRLRCPPSSSSSSSSSADGAAPACSLSVSVAPGRSLEFDLGYFDKVVVVGAGKAGPAMASGLEEVLGPAHIIKEGIIVTKYGHAQATGNNDGKGGANKPLKTVRVIEAAHPVPDASSVAATKEVLALVDKYSGDPRALLVVLLSGGGSALWTAPEAPLELADIQALNRALLHGGLPIQDMNALRKHVDQVKGGGLLRRAGQAQVLGLVLSDVIGDDLGVVASGPTVPFGRDFVQALHILDRHNLRPSRLACDPRQNRRAREPLPETSTELPIKIYEYLLQGAKKQVREAEFHMPPPAAGTEFACPSAQPSFSSASAALVTAASAPGSLNVCNVLVGSNRHSLSAASERARLLGYEPHILTDRLDGEARTAAEWLARAAIPVDATTNINTNAASPSASSSSASPAAPASSYSRTPRAWIAGGETTVTFAPSSSSSSSAAPALPSPGLGGRNQELALAAALHLDRHEQSDLWGGSGEGHTVLLSGGSDGTDGPTDATGAIVDCRTVSQGRRANLDARDYLQRHDSYNFFQKLDQAQAATTATPSSQRPLTHLKPGPTGTNVGDIHVVLVR